MATLLFGQAKPRQTKLFLLCMVQLFSQMENLMSWQFSVCVATEDTTVGKCFNEKEADFG